MIVQILLLTAAIYLRSLPEPGNTVGRSFQELLKSGRDERIFGSFPEDRKLVRQLGDQYRKYQQSVSMLFPWRWLKAEIDGHVSRNSERLPHKA